MIEMSAGGSTQGWTQGYAEGYGENRLIGVLVVHCVPACLRQRSHNTSTDGKE